MTTEKLSPVGAFSLTDTFIISPDSGPCIALGGTEGIDYVCYNCSEILVEKKPSHVEIGGNVLLQCSKCTAYNHFDDPKYPVNLPQEELRLYKVAAPFSDTVVYWRYHHSGADHRTLGADR